MKALVLSCNTGQGHNAAGMALMEALKARGIECAMRDTLAFANPKASDVICAAYVNMTVKAPWLFGGMYRAGDMISSAKRKSPVYLTNTAYAQRLKWYLEENNIDFVLAPHLFPAEAMTYLKRKHETKIPFYAVATDYTCIPFWEETEAELFFTPHEELNAEFAARGISRSRLRATGIPVSARFSAPKNREEARSMLGVGVGEKLFLVMTGSMGFGNVTTMIDNLAERGQVFALTGRNARLKAALDERWDDTRVRAVGFTDEVSLYMDACDVLLTKPGGLTSTEAAVRNVPLLLTDPIPGCETRNSLFFGRKNMALCARTSTSAAVADSLAGDAALRRAMLAAQREAVPPGAAERVLDAILR